MILRVLIICLLYLSSLNALDTLSSQPIVNLTAGAWDDYYHNTLSATDPYHTLELALQYFEKEDKTSGLAVDLGTGTGRDSLFLLKKGWHVLSIDAESLAIDIILQRAETEKLDNLEVMISSFSDMLLPDNIDLVNASYSLPFCSPDNFPKCWQKITDHLAIGGRFSGHFFGDQDDWASDPFLTIHTQEQMLQLFKDNFAIEYLKIDNDISATADGQQKHWHVFNVVAKKVK